MRTTRANVAAVANATAYEWMVTLEMKITFSILILTLMTAVTQFARADTWMGFGPRFMHIADINAEQALELGPNYGAEHKLGFGYNAIVFFGIDFWTWRGRHCIYLDDTCDIIRPQRVAEITGLPLEDLTDPLRYRIPPGTVLITLLLFGGYMVWSYRGHREDAALQYSDDPDYQHALSLVMEGTKNAPLRKQAELSRDNFSKGVTYLVEKGIDQEDASKNLMALVDKLLELRESFARNK